MSKAGSAFMEERGAKMCSCTQVNLVHALTRLIAALWTCCVFLIFNIAVIFLIQSEICGLLLHNLAAVFSVGGTVFSSCKCLWITKVTDTKHSNLFGVISMITERRRKISFFFQNVKRRNTNHVISRMVQTSLYFLCVLFIHWWMTQRVDSIYWCCSNALHYSFC